MPSSPSQPAIDAAYQLDAANLSSDESFDSSDDGEHQYPAVIRSCNANPDAQGRGGHSSTIQGRGCPYAPPGSRASFTASAVIAAAAIVPSAARYHGHPHERIDQHKVHVATTKRARSASCRSCSTGSIYRAAGRASGRGARAPAPCVSPGSRSADRAGRGPWRIPAIRFGPFVEQVMSFWASNPRTPSTVRRRVSKWMVTHVGSLAAREAQSVTKLGWLRIRPQDMTSEAIQQL